jgi:hypothetical protein
MLDQAEIGHVRPALPVHQNVARLDVAVQNAMLVSAMDRVRHAGNQLGRLAQVGLGTVFLVVERARLDQLHGEVMTAGVFTDVINRHDVGVVQMAGFLSFHAETPDLLRGGQVAGQDHLERHDPVQALFPGAVNDAHAAASNLLKEYVISEVAQTRRCPPFAGWREGESVHGESFRPENRCDRAGAESVGLLLDALFRGRIRGAFVSHGTSPDRPGCADTRNLSGPYEPSLRPVFSG